MNTVEMLKKISNEMSYLGSKLRSEPDKVLLDEEGNENRSAADYRINAIGKIIGIYASQVNSVLNGNPVNDELFKESERLLREIYNAYK